MRQLATWAAILILGVVAGCPGGGAQETRRDDGVGDAISSTPASDPPAPQPVFTSDRLAPLFGEMAAHYGMLEQCPFAHLEGDHPDICRLWAVQQMLTTVSAIDGAVGGAFRLPYFWHWVEPNPRLDIRLMPQGDRLGDLPPPEGFRRYKTFAHVDRLPSLYLGDLAAPSPRYSHPAVGEFASFGWCSEREMAMCALLTSWGFEAKVHQTGIHVTTRVWLDAEAAPLEVVLDTTFDSVGVQEADHGDLPAWRVDHGSGAQVGFYNRTCRDPDEQARVVAIQVSEAARERLLGQAEAFFGGLSSQ